MLVFDVELLSWNTVRDLSGDGGILKKIIKEGEEWATPKEAYEVLGLLCPAISHVVKTMRKGEKAELSVKFSYVVKNGNKTIRSGLQILPNLNLTVDVELVSWKSVIDVTGDDKVVKKIMREGNGYDHPGEGSKVKGMQG